MIEFLLVFMIGNEITNKTQIFSDINKCNEVISPRIILHIFFVPNADLTLLL